MSLLSKLPPHTGWDAMMQAFGISANKIRPAAPPKAPLVQPYEVAEIDVKGKYTCSEDVNHMHGGGWSIFQPNGEFMCSRRVESNAKRLVRQLNNPT